MATRQNTTSGILPFLDSQTSTDLNIPTNVCTTNTLNITVDRSANTTWILENETKEPWIIYLTVPFIYIILMKQVFLISHKLNILHESSGTNNFKDILKPIFILLIFYILYIVMAFKLAGMKYYPMYCSILLLITNMCIVYLLCNNILCTIQCQKPENRYQRIQHFVTHFKCSTHRSHIALVLSFVIHIVVLLLSLQAVIIVLMNIFCSLGHTIILYNFIADPLLLIVKCGYEKPLQFMLWVGLHTTEHYMDNRIVSPTSLSFVAAQFGHIACLRVLLKYGADLTEMWYDFNIFTDAVLNDNDVIDMPIGWNVLADMRNLGKVKGDGWSSLYIAVWQNHVDCVELLLQNGAAPKTVIGKGVSALYIALWKNHLDCVKTLLSRGADIRSVSSYGYTQCMLHHFLAM